MDTTTAPIRRRRIQVIQKPARDTGQIIWLLVLDIDDTLTRSTEYGRKIYLPHLRRVAQSWGLPMDLVMQPHNDFPQRTEVRDVAFLFETVAAVMHRRGDTFPLGPQEMIDQLISPYQRDLVELEGKMKLYEGVAETLAEIRRQWPGLFILAHTDCPDWLAMLRLHKTGILNYFDGLVAVSPEVPDLSDTPYAECLGVSQAWLRSVVADIPHNLRLRYSVPQEYAKPSALGLRAVISTLRLLQERVISVGNNRYKEGVVAAQSCPLKSVKFVLVSHPGEEESDPPDDLRLGEIPVDRQIDHIATLLPYLKSVLK